MSLLFCRAGRVRGDLEHLGDPDRLRPPTCLYATTLGINNHLSSLYLSVLNRIIELGVSRPKGIRGRWYVDQCISATVSLSDCLRFLDCPWMRRWVSFHVSLLSDPEFWQHLPVVLRIHTLPKLGRVSGEQRGGAAKIRSQTRAEHGS
jgi:hypothetical protein